MSLQKTTIQLLEKKSIALALQFGSSVKGGERPGSDVDIGFVFIDTLPNVRQVPSVFHDLSLAFQKEFPGKRVDIVFLQETPLSMQYAALQEGKALYVNSPDDYANYLEDTMKLYFDFQPVEQYVQSVLNAAFAQR